MMPAAEPEPANLAKVLAVFARWRRCSACGELVLFVDEKCAADGDFECGACLYRADSAWATNDEGNS